MMIQKWLTMASALVHDTRIFALKRIERKHPDREQPSSFYTVDAPDWINVVALTAEKDIVLVRQYRHGTDQITLEIPGGMVDPGERPLNAAKRELREETGFESDAWTQIGFIHANPAFMTNGCTTFLARDAKRSASQSFDEHEELEVELHPLGAFFEMIDAGEITHGVVISAAYFLLAIEDI